MLALAYVGARGNTADEIATVLGLPAERQESVEGFRALMQGLQVSILLKALKSELSLISFYLWFSNSKVSKVALIT